MSNLVSERAAVDIEKQIAKLLSDVGASGPPLNLNHVRELLALDLRYYMSTDIGLLDETVHRIRIGGKQALENPGVLRNIIEKLGLRALFIPQKKMIMVDRSMHHMKQRWSEAHEIGHSIIPWHGNTMLGDENRTLSVNCHAKVEAEANFAAARLLFMNHMFDERLLSSRVTMTRVKHLAEEFQNSFTTTLWRTVEAMKEPGFGIVGQNPRGPVNVNRQRVQQFIVSPAFRREFATTTGRVVFEAMRKRAHTSDTFEVVLEDIGRQQHVFRVEMFYNQYQTLILGVYHSMVGESVLV